MFVKKEKDNKSFFFFFFGGGGGATYSYVRLPMIWISDTTK